MIGFSGIFWKTLWQNWGLMTNGYLSLAHALGQFLSRSWLMENPMVYSSLIKVSSKEILYRLICFFYEQTSGQQINRDKTHIRQHTMGFGRKYEASTFQTKLSIFCDVLTMKQYCNDPRKNASHICVISQNDQSQLRLLVVVNKTQFNPVNTRCGTHHTPTHIIQSIKLGHHNLSHLNP